MEGREANIEKARFARAGLSLQNLELIQDDVRNLARDRHGRFDMVLALGILYHLDAPGVFFFIERLAQVCDWLCVIDTHVTESRLETFSNDGHTYKGTYYAEPDTSDELARDTLGAGWATGEAPSSLVIRCSTCWGTSGSRPHRVQSADS
jgi:hypothetical protein